ncbi:MAG: hypothetical protein IV105_20050 [Rhizobacter sp.]|nr:hypothetical protein [Rhizobacter sp.]
MTLQQLHAVKLWHVSHKHDCPIEYHTWDTVLTVWLVGWMGEPAALLLWWPEVAVACALFFFAPTAYVALRRSLHQRGRLRCDWLESLSR